MAPLSFDRVNNKVIMIHVMGIFICLENILLQNLSINPDAMTQKLKFQVNIIEKVIIANKN
jgi:hypothetical protein